MIFGLLLWGLTTLVLGYLVITLLWPKNALHLEEFLIDLCLAIAIGAGLSSCIFFLWLLFSPFSDVRLFFFESAALGALLLWRFCNFRARSLAQPEISSFEQCQTSRRLRFVRIMSYVVVGLSIAAFLLVALSTLHGQYDGWSIWNMRARFLFRGGSNWTNAFSNLLHYSHPDYPLLIPATIARSWVYIGRETQVTAVAVGMAFTFGTVGLLWLSLSMLRSTTQGLLAGVVLLGTPFFIAHGASQYADVPLGLYFLATLVLINIHARFPEPKLMVLAGLTAGLSAWTKNEGLLFVGSVMVAISACSVASRGLRNCVRKLVPFTVGLTPILAVVVYFKASLAPQNDLVSGQGVWLTMQRLLNLSRYWEVSKAFGIQVFQFGDWHPFMNVPFLLLFYFLLMGLELEDRRIEVAVSVVTILLVATGYFVTYIITPRSLEWHLMTSLNRLYLQLWPSFLFVYFLIVRRPERAVLAS